MTEPMSDEVRKMELKEKKRWLSVGQAQSLRKNLGKTLDELNVTIRKFDENPEDENEAMVFIVITGLLTDSLAREAVNSAQLIKGLIEEASDS